MSDAADELATRLLLQMFGQDKVLIEGWKEKLDVKWLVAVGFVKKEVEPLRSQLEQAHAAMENEAIVTRELRSQLVSVKTALNAIALPVEYLACHQEQCDEDGVQVKVSRQAVDEVVNAINQIAISLPDEDGK